MKFDWDENKASENIDNHGVTFDEASKTFNDPWAIEEFDSSHSSFKEKRYTIIGLVSIRLLRVTYTVRENEGEEVIWLISAREAIGYDERAYEEARNNFDI
jgi:uncharacterized DUF497 family protein